MSRIIPKAPSPNTKLTATWGREVVQYLRQSRMLPAVGQLASYASGGTTMNQVSSVQQAEAAPSYFPWAVRWYPHDKKDPSIGEWQIYLPFGSAILNPNSTKDEDFYIANMDAAKDENGVEILDWYKIPDPTDETAISITNDTRQGINLYERRWNVYALFKPWPRLKVSTDKRAYDTVYEQRIVAIIYDVKWEETGKTVILHGVLDQQLNDAQTIVRDVTAPFFVRYVVKENQAGKKDAQFDTFVDNCNMMCGRLNVKINKVLVNNFETVTVNVKHQNEEFTLEITEQRKSSNDDQTAVLIYEMEDNVVTADHRENIVKIPYYND